MPNASTKPIAEDCLYFTVAKLARQHLLRAGCRWTSITTWPNGDESRVAVSCHDARGGLCLYLDYTLHDKDGYAVPFTDRIDLTSERCNVGEHRWWLICPNCRTRRRIVYLAPGRSHFACRLCSGVRYRSSLRSRRQRRWARGDFD